MLSIVCWYCSFFCFCIKFAYLSFTYDLYVENIWVYWPWSSVTPVLSYQLLPSFRSAWGHLDDDYVTTNAKVSLTSYTLLSTGFLKLFTLDEVISSLAVEETGKNWLVGQTFIHNQHHQIFLTAVFKLECQLYTK